MWSQFKNYIKEEHQQQKVSNIATTLLFAGVILNAAFATFHFLLQDPLFFITSDPIEMLITLVCGFIVFHKVIPFSLMVKKGIGFVFIFGVISSIAYLKMIRQNRISFDEFNENVFEYLGMVFLFTSFFYLFNNLNLILNNTHIKNKEALDLAHQKLLQQQLNPHFLFNAFNSLYSLSLEQSEKTPETILKLSGMMRYLTDDTQKMLVPLKNELAFIEDYIAIEKVRFGEEALIQYSFKAFETPILIPPLLLITLVENAFKHGFYTNKPSAFVTIKGEYTKNTIYFTVTNSKMPQQHFNASSREGKGLKNLQERLQYHYPNKHQLIIDDDDSTCTATLSILVTHD